MTNLFSVMLMCQEFAPLLISAKGKIVNIGSVAALIPYVRAVSHVLAVLTPPPPLLDSYAFGSV